MSVKIQAEKRLARERRCREALEQEILKYREYCTAQENEIEALQGLLRKHGISFDRVERPVVGSTIDVIAEVNDLSEKVKMMDQDDFSHPTAWAPHCAMAGGTSSLWASPERRHVQQWLIVTGLVCKISANDKQACCTQNVLEAAKLILSSIMQTIPPRFKDPHLLKETAVGLSWAAVSCTFFQVCWRNKLAFVRQANCRFCSFGLLGSPNWCKFAKQMWIFLSPCPKWMRIQRKSDQKSTAITLVQIKQTGLCCRHVLFSQIVDQLVLQVLKSST